MSEEDSNDKSVLEEIEETRKEETPKKFSETKSHQKTPNRVRAGHKLAAIGQKAKEEKMRKKVEESMIKPKTWVSIGVLIGGICVGGLWFGFPLLSSKKVVEQPVKIEEEKPKTNKYFG